MSIYTRNNVNQRYVKNKFNRNVNTTKRINKPRVQRGGTKL